MRFQIRGFSFPTNFIIQSITVDVVMGDFSMIFNSIKRLKALLILALLIPNFSETFV